MKNLEDRLAALTPDQRKLLAHKLQSNHPDAPTAILPRARKGPFPVSYAQSRWWFLSRLFPDDTGPNMGRLLTFHRPVAGAVLRCALETIIGRPSGLPNHPGMTSLTQLSRTPARMYRTGDLARFRPDGAIEFLGRVDQQEMWGRLRRNLRRRASAARKDGKPPLEDALPGTEAMSGKLRRLMEAQVAATMAYNPSPYGGHVAVFRTRGRSLFRYTPPEQEWGRLAAGGVDVFRIAGAHHNILEPAHVDSLAEALKYALG